MPCLLLSNEASYQTDETVIDETSVSGTSPLSSPFIPGAINQIVRNGHQLNCFSEHHGGGMRANPGPGFHLPSPC